MPLISVVETPSYIADAEKTLTEADRNAVIDLLAANPLSGVLIKGTGGLRKMRIGLEGRGKRGGGRVIYWFHSEGLPVVLLAIFAKNQASDLTAKERAALSRIADQLLQDFRRTAR
jgi:hypothetical protein